MKKFIDNLTIYTIIAFIIIGFIAFIVSPKIDFSENENRYLEKFPSFSFEKLKEGEYIQGIENYINDHFPLRNFFISLYTNTEKIEGKTEINSIYIGKNNRLFIPFTKKTDETKIISALNDFVKDDLNISLMLVPTSISIYPEYLKTNHEEYDELEEIKNITKSVNMDSVSLEETFTKNKNKYELFYRTDHHWTYYGAYLAYEEYAKKEKIPYKPVSEVDKIQLTDSFLGTSHSKLNIKIPSDIIYTLKDHTKYSVKYVYEEKETESLYNYDYLDKKDKYATFLDNNHALIEVTNLNREDDSHLLIIKNSYGNAFVPLVAQNYKSISIIDLRYYNNRVSNYINENNISNILIIYDINGIYSDTSILKLK